MPPVIAAGRVSAPILPATVQFYDGEQVIQTVDVTTNGYFELELPERYYLQDSVALTARYTIAPGEIVRSALHEFDIMRHGPRVMIESHRNGDMINGRPWLRGVAAIELTPEEQELTGRRERQQFGVSEVLVSVDNGRSFMNARGGAEWRFRLETSEMDPGPVPILVKAVFEDGRTATERFVLIVDTIPPEVMVASPVENSRHAQSLLVHGNAQDEFGIEHLEVSLRPGDKFGYEVPQFIQGLYLDTQVGGATYGSAGIGLSFFDDNVRIQAQAGAAPPGRFTGNVLGGKLLANVVTFPFNYYFGPDWSFFSMALALGANFSYFPMDEEDGLV
ncbi:MAG: neuraminidase, partial [Spirochaeta sp.]|nr:neuraminidase [Spirochaeta sp.]